MQLSHGTVLMIPVAAAVDVAAQVVSSSLTALHTLNCTALKAVLYCRLRCTAHEGSQPEAQEPDCNSSPAAGAAAYS